MHNNVYLLNANGMYPKMVNFMLCEYHLNEKKSYTLSVIHVVCIIKYISLCWIYEV